MKKTILSLVLLFGVSNGSFSWGFFAHKMINRLAVFTLPEQLLLFYKNNIDYVTDHAVDPDKRRYTVPDEAPRHYIDLDHFELVLPRDTMPTYWKEAVAKFTEDTLNAYGTVPWHVLTMKYRLTEAFKEKNCEKILKYSAEIGHYIADAHVPLHATENYNGQLSGQTGIHGFWESRLPELFSDNYDFFVGRAFYINHVLEFAWKASEGSFAAKDSVLEFERMLSASFPSDRKYSLEQKGQNQVKVYAKEYAEEYHNRLGNQVERRMRESVLAVGCLWYTCWVDAGQPDLTEVQSKPLSDEERKRIIAEEHQLIEKRQMIGREEK